MLQPGQRVHVPVSGVQCVSAWDGVNRPDVGSAGRDQHSLSKREGYERGGRHTSNLVGGGCFGRHVRGALQSCRLMKFEAKCG